MTYDDLYQQTWAAEWLIPTNPDDSKIISEGEFTLEPADGVERGEIFELVAMESLHRLAPPDTINNLSNMAGRFELSFQPQLVNRMDFASESITLVKENGNTIDANFLGERQPRLEDDLLWWDNTRTDTGYENTTSGAGGASDNVRSDRVFLNFRDQFGSGPRVDRHDLMYYNFALNERFDEGNYALHQCFRFWWHQVADDDSVRNR